MRVTCINTKVIARLLLQAGGKSHERGGAAPAAGRRHARRAQAVAARQARVPLHAPPGTLLHARYATTYANMNLVARSLQLEHNLRYHLFSKIWLNIGFSPEQLPFDHRCSKGRNITPVTTIFVSTRKHRP